MFSRIAPLAKTLTRPVNRIATRNMVTIQEAMTADDARKISCYSGFDYAIDEDSMVIDAVQKFAAFKVGCLVCVDGSGKFCSCRETIERSITLVSDTKISYLHSVLT